MKRLLLAVAIALIAASALAADVADRDVLITADGTVFAIAAERSEDGLAASLSLTVQSGGKSAQSTLPESTSGLNGLPTLAYDSDSKTLFVVWMRQPNTTSSELLVNSYNPANGKWNQATVIDAGPVVRSNVTIRFTRQVQMLQRDGATYADTSALILHAAWWQKGPWGESAFYAVMPLSASFPSTPDIHDLTEFVTAREIPQPATSDFMRHVALLAGPTSNAVDAIFSDSHTNSFYRMTLRPIADGRVHITVGVKGPHLGGPHSLAFDWSGRTGTIASGDGNTVIFTSTTDDKVSWVTLRNGEWLPVQSLSLSDKVTVNTAMAALARLAASSE
jgi:hypothetical protein